MRKKLFLFLDEQACSKTVSAISEKKACQKLFSVFGCSIVGLKILKIESIKTGETK